MLHWRSVKNVQHFNRDAWGQHWDHTFQDAWRVERFFISIPSPLILLAIASRPAYT